MVVQGLPDFHPLFRVDVPNTELLVLPDSAKLRSRWIARQAPKLFCGVSSKKWAPSLVHVVTASCVKLKKLVAFRRRRRNT